MTPERTGLRVDARASAGDLSLDVRFTVAPGETLAVLGPNGSGKTTLLRVVAGLHPLDDGEVQLEDRVLESAATGVAVAPEDRSIGLVFQDLLLFAHLDAVENVAFGLRAAGMTKAAAHHDAEGWLDRFGLSDLRAARIQRLSGGEAQRVALARALAPAPAVLLLDEPLSALDADVRADVRRQLRDHLQVHAGPCVVVTHEPLDAAVLADRVVVLEAGRITAEGTMADLVARPRTAWAAELAGTNLLRAVASGDDLRLTGGGRLTAADRPGEGDVLVAVRPAAVALHRAHPEGSPRNVWQATVAEVEGYGERVRVRLAGAVPLVAEVTIAAVAELDLRPGTPVWASVKATEIAVYPV